MFARLGRKNMVVIKRWSYKQGGRKAEFHCIIPFLQESNASPLQSDFGLVTSWF